MRVKPNSWYTRQVDVAQVPDAIYIVNHVESEHSYTGYYPALNMNHVYFSFSTVINIKCRERGMQKIVRRGKILFIIRAAKKKPVQDGNLCPIDT